MTSINYNIDYIHLYQIIIKQLTTEIDIPIKNQCCIADGGIIKHQ